MTARGARACPSGLPDADDFPDAVNYPALALLAQGYLTLDWPDYYPDAWTAVDDYVANETVSALLSEEIDRAIAVTACEEDLRALIIDELGCGYLPEAAGITMTT